MFVIEATPVLSKRYTMGGGSPMKVMEAIEGRRSIRDYDDRSVPEEKLKRVLEAARLSPSASNRQDRKFVVVRDEARRQTLSQAAFGQVYVAQAPVVIAAVSTNPGYVMACGVPSFSIDLAIAIDHMTLAAVNEELGTCWIGAFHQDKVKNILGIPKKYTVAALLALGFPRETPQRTPRKALDEIVSYETFT
jgi:nitroreductase